MDDQQMEQYFEQHAVDGELPQEEMVKLLTGAADMDTVTTGEPDAAEVPEAGPEDGGDAATPEADAKPEQEAPPPSPPEADATAANEAMAAQVQRLSDEVAALKGMGVGEQAAAAGPEPEAEPEPEPDRLASLREDWPEVADAVDGVIQEQQARIRALEEQLTRVQPITEQMAQERAVQEHYHKIVTAHPDVQDVVVSQAFADWQAAQPGFMKQIFAHVLNHGTAEQVIELVDGFKGAHPSWGKEATEAGEQDAARQAAVQAAKAKAQNATPKSLSDIPGGAAVETDATEALMQMGPGARMDKMLAMAPDKIEEMLRRAV